MTTIRQVRTEDGARLAVHDFGGDGRSVLLLHGLTANAVSMAAYAELLCDRFHVWALDFRGRGQSCGTPVPGIVGHARDVETVLRTLIDEPTVLVGHSMGALVAVVVAGGGGGDLVQRLVLVDAAGDVPPKVLAAIGASLTRLEETFPSIDAYRTVLRAAPHLQPWNRYHEAFLAADLEVIPDGSVRSRLSAEQIRAELQANLSLRMAPYLSAVGVPTLLLRAMQPVPPGDIVFLDRPEAEAARGLLANGRLVEEPACHHYSIVFAPGEVTKNAIRAFLLADALPLAEGDG